MTNYQALLILFGIVVVWIYAVRGLSKEYTTLIGEKEEESKRLEAAASKSEETAPASA